MNCEDIMLELIFQHLQPCMHLMLTQRKLLHDFDPYCQNVDKFLLLIPACCSYQPTTNEDNRSNRKTSTSSLDYSKLPEGVNWNSYGVHLKDSLYGNYHAYLCDARNKIASCKMACSTWVNRYDGCDTHKNSKNLDDTDLFLASFKDDFLDNFNAGKNFDFMTYE